LTQITPDNAPLGWSAFRNGHRSRPRPRPSGRRRDLYHHARQPWASTHDRPTVWRYTYPANDGFHIGHRGVAAYKDLVYLTTPDAHLIALDARNGTVRWNVVIADAKKGYWSTNAPLVVRNHLIVGVSGDFDNLPGTSARSMPHRKLTF
jgi:alcohol dehydrogenase (cytochrome c)